MTKPLGARVRSKTSSNRKEPESSIAVSPQQQLLNVIVAAAFSKKAENVTLLDLRGLTSVTDFFVICSGDSSPQRRAIRDVIREKTREFGEKVWHVEEDTEPEWILMDYVDIVVHIFDPQRRLYYDLEHLWGDAPTTDVKPDDYVTKP